MLVDPRRHKVREDNDDNLPFTQKRGSAVETTSSQSTSSRSTATSSERKEGDFPVTESIARRTIALPFYNQMTQDEVRYVAEVLGELVASVGKV